MPDNHSTTASTRQNSAAGHHQEASFGDQSKGDNPNDYYIFKLDEERLEVLRLEDEQLFPEESQAQSTTATSAEHGHIKREQDKAADAVTAVAESAPPSLSNQDKMTTPAASNA